jgi:Ca2+-binding EF-hand superfamily protein
MKLSFRWLKCTIALASPLVFAYCLAFAPAAVPDNTPPARDDVQDIVFLGETRPVLLRFHVCVDGKPVPVGADDFLKHLFAYLDVRGTGALSKAEIARAPTVNDLLGANLVVQFGGRGMGGSSPSPSMDDIDADRDGKVTPAELAAYYRKKGYVPFQFQAESGYANNPAMAMMGGSSEPAVEAVSKAIFSRIDTNGDGKLSRAELAAAPAVLLPLDSDDDEIVTARELVPAARAANPNMFAAVASAALGGFAKGSTGNSQVMLVTTPGEVPADLVRHMQERYGPKGAGTATKLSRKDLGLDEATFAALDANRDGVLDAGELAGFVRRRPDLELSIRLGKSASESSRVVLVKSTEGQAQAEKASAKESVVTLDLGRTRLDLRADVGSGGGPDLFSAFVRPQLAGQFKQADKDKNGYLDEKEAEASRVFRGLFKAADRDGDGKLYEQEVFAYLDQMRALQQQAQAGCVTVAMTDQSRGLFDLLDVNRDGRLSVREMRGAVQLLERLAPPGKDYLTTADIPRSYQLSLRPGAAGAGGGPANLVALYFSPDKAETPTGSTAGPLWFRKMDRNRDGDVSRREFLFSEEMFRRIDTDSDGLISPQEAERFEALQQKRK